MNKGELIDKVASDLSFTKVEAKKVVECVFENISDCMAKGEAVRLVGFGTFGIRKREARMARNPRTGEKISIKAMNVPFFKAGKELKEKVK
ncbi:MAG TPA: DNA-binding protein HU [Candidatus Atribacteria bacterium]|nr:DNA-binding protein HU [Candidatus Atribacteria bacterium]